MFQDTRPAELDPLAAGDPWAEFRVSGPRAVATVLRELRDAQVSVMLNAPSGAAVTTTLWALDDTHGRLTFSADGAEPALARVIEADEAVAVAYLESIKLQFDLSGLVLVRGNGGAALQCAWPECVYRFQRRQAYRVRPGGRGGPIARLRHPALPDMQLALRVIDLSTGGVALWLPGDVPPLARGIVIAGVELELDVETRFSASLALQHVSEAQGLPGDPRQGQRLGCAWQKLPGGAERLLQRWIDRTQQRRRLLAL